MSAVKLHNYHHLLCLLRYDKEQGNAHSLLLQQKDIIIHSEYFPDSDWLKAHV